MLQTIIDQSAAEDAKFSWDLITFVFTVVIGLFAALFTLVTIYQTTLSASPGRRKCNRRAIRFWATKTKKEWSWNDLNRLSIATTPVLRADDILQFLEERMKGKEDREGRYDIINLPSTPPAAKWLQFLDHIGVKKKLMRKPEHVELTAADLPSQPPAATWL